MSTAPKDIHELRVHVQSTLAGDGIRTLRQVLCPRTGTFRRLDACEQCPRLIRIDRRQSGAFLMCDVAGAPAPPAPRTESASTTCVRELMAHDVICVSPAMRVSEVVRLLDQSDISGAPVVDERGAPIGIVSKTDLLRAWSRPSAEDRVAEIMTPLTFGVAEDTSIARAAAMMAYEGVHRMVVLSNDGVVVGLLSALDLARWIARGAGYALPTPAGHVR
jgi:CBS domain-containing protein